MTTLIAAAIALLAAPPSVDDFFKDFVAKREHIQTLEAQFVQESNSPDETVRYAGRIVFAKPRQLLFEYLDPKVIYAIAESRVYEYEAEIGQVQIYDVEDSAQADAFFIAFDNSASRLREAYEVTIEDAEPGDCASRVLTLVPKKAAAKAGAPEDATPLYREIRLYLRADDLLPCRIRAFGEEGVDVSITIKDYKLNVGGETPVQFQVPEGTKIIQNEEKFETAGPGGKTLPEKTAPAAQKPADK